MRKCCITKLTNNQLTHNPRKFIFNFRKMFLGITLFQTLHVKVRRTNILLFFLLGLDTQIKIFGEAPPYSKAS